MQKNINDFIVNNKKLVSLYKNRNLYGVGPYLSKMLLKYHGSTVFQKIYSSKKYPFALLGLTKIINKIFKKNLKKDQKKNIIRIINIGNYRGERHKKNLPVRGQRTKTNAKTRKHRGVY